jgi:imidazolonepropionase-like amidohydrolase
LGAAAEQGTIEVGTRPDLVLLTPDPLVDIRAPTDIAGVVSAGRYSHPAERRALIEAARAALRAPPP